MAAVAALVISTVSSLSEGICFLLWRRKLSHPRSSRRSTRRFASFLSGALEWRISVSHCAVVMAAVKLVEIEATRSAPWETTDFR